MKYTFNKEDLGWFIDIKWFPKRFKHHLAMVIGADILLDKISNKQNKVELEISTRLKPNFKRLERHEILGLFNGAIYIPKEDIIVNEYGQNWLWLCFVTLFVFGYYPKNIYYKVL